ncbi:MAG TPA: FxSxx-COOH system tetratricopeptide repeat protein [Candidatus Limnocylindrales bacterium]|nr:FxSxx-COOH system tetratricopeptide repeat protein [Candidatus Limnocylindrales bacterium]
MSTGKIITFYSYKGGTGRTMALANVAWILASNGQRVLAVDWDLESPGLHRYFHPFLEDKHLSKPSSLGVIDMVRAYAEAALRPLSEAENEDWIAPFADVERFVTPLAWTFDALRDSSEGRSRKAYLDLLPAGQQTPYYSTAVSTFDWIAFFERLGGNAFLAALARSMRENYDYVLIDSRTGVSDGAGICTIRLPDTVVAAFTMNDQSMDGTVAVAGSIVRQRRTDPVRIVPVPMRVEDAEQLKLEAGRDHARRSFAPFLPRSSPEEIDRYWGDIEIPYKPFYAYEEILAAFADRPYQTGTLLAAYERLTATLTGGRITRLRPLEERNRRLALADFERQRTATATDVFISYAAVDRMWAEWIAGLLTESGLRVTIREVDFPAEPSATEASGVREANRLVVLLSQDYAQSHNAEELWKEAGQRDPAGGARLLIPIRLDNARLPQPFLERIPVDLAGLNEERVKEVLRDAFDLPLIPPRPDEQAPRRRFPAAEPPIWNVQQRNVTFTGRRALLDEIRNRLSATETAVAPQVLFGLGGVGKTLTALEYAHRFRADYDVVWWVSALQASVARSTLAGLGDQLGVTATDNLNARIAATLDALRQGTPYRRWLLVFDNADDPDELRDYLPQGAGHVLLTSRNLQAWAREPNVQTIEVGVFTRQESVSLLHRRVPILPEADVQLVAERLGDLPLAIEQAAAWLAAAGEPVSRYLHRIEKQPAALTEDLPLDYRKTGAQPWLVSLQSLRERSPAAAKLLEVCAFFADEPIPISLLYSKAFHDVLQPYDEPLRDPSLLMGRAIREVNRYALARVDSRRPVTHAERRRRLTDIDTGRQTSIQMHRLVQVVIRASLPPEEAQANRRHVHEILANANPRDPDQPDNWPIYADLWPHILPPKTLESNESDVRFLLLDMARYLWKRVDYATCEQLTQQAIDAWTARFGPDDPLTQLMRFHQANALRLQGRFQAAYDIDVDAYSRLQRLLGEDDEYSVMVAGSLAADMRALGDFTGACELDRRTEELARELFGPNTSRALIAAHNLAISLRLVGDLRGALQRDESTLAGRREALGERHPYTLYSAGQYGRDLRETGQLLKSRRVLESAVDAHRQVLGESHPETLRAMANLAVTLRKLGDFTQAQKLSAETLERMTELHGFDHPDVQACAMNLASDESALGLDEAAWNRAKPVCDWYRDKLGSGHLFTLAYTNNLAIFIRKLGRVDEAYAMTKDVVLQLTEKIGADHPYTLAANVNLGNCLYDKGDIAAARISDEQEYTRISQVLGPDHPDTLAAASNLVISRRGDGDGTGAQMLLDFVTQAYHIVLGDHPSTRAAAAGMRLSCDLEPPPT